MTDASAPTRFWLLDWHGWMLDHDPVADRLIHSPFRPGSRPGISFVAPRRAEPPFDVCLEKRVSMPRALPALEMLPRAEGAVCFRDKDRGTYLRSKPGANLDAIDVDAPEPRDWENWLPITEDFLRGLSVLLSGNGSVPTGRLSDRLTLELGDTRLELTRNIAAVERIARLPAGLPADIAFTRDGEESMVLRVIR